VASKPADNTACPHCGHSPIGETDERCPQCYQWVRELPRFHSARQKIHNDAEQELGDAVQGTRIGGLDLITSDAEAHPGLAAALLAALGLALGLAGLGAVPAVGSPHGYLGLAAFDLICAILLYAYPAVARPIVAIASILQIAAVLYLGRVELFTPQSISLAAVPLAVLLGASGEPGPKVRGLAFAVGLGLLVYSGVVRVGSRSFGAIGPLLDEPQVGFRARLPVGYRALRGPEQLGPEVPLTSLDPQMKLFAFHDPVREVGGLWGLAPAGRYQVGRLAEGFAESLDAPSSGAKPVAADLGLKLPATTFERGLGPGRLASVTAFKLPDERVAVLVLGGPSAEVARDRAALARGAAFAPAARP
jgi:hypothetical protein